jgi:hypothetical protein
MRLAAVTSLMPSAKFRRWSPLPMRWRFIPRLLRRSRWWNKFSRSPASVN